MVALVTSGMSVWTWRGVLINRAGGNNWFYLVFIITDCVVLVLFMCFEKGSFVTILSAWFCHTRPNPVAYSHHSKVLLSLALAPLNFAIDLPIIIHLSIQNMNLSMADLRLLTLTSCFFNIEPDGLLHWKLIKSQKLHWEISWKYIWIGRARPRVILTKGRGVMPVVHLHGGR